MLETLSDLLDRAVENSIHDEVRGVHDFTVETFEAQEGLKQRFVEDEAAHPHTESTIYDQFLIQSLLLILLDSQHSADNLKKFVGETSKVDV